MNWCRYMKALIKKAKKKYEFFICPKLSIKSLGKRNKIVRI